MTKRLRRFIVQLSAHQRGHQKPEGDLSCLLQCVFVVEAPRVEDIEPPLRAAIEHARKDETGLVRHAKTLYVDWILDPCTTTGLAWECSIQTQCPEGAQQQDRSHGFDPWRRDDDIERLYSRGLDVER